MGFKGVDIGIREMYDIEVDERKHNQKGNMPMINQRQIIPSLKNESVFKVLLLFFYTRILQDFELSALEMKGHKIFTQDLFFFKAKQNSVLKSIE